MLTIKQYQRNLRHYYGYYMGNIDGLNGVSTKAAVRRFQSGHGLTVDGKYGAKTNSKLVSCIKTLQTKLGVKADGVVGDVTIAAIKKIQAKYGLKQDGIAGTATMAKLNGSSTSIVTTNSGTSASSSHFSKSEFKCGCRGRYCSGYPAGNMSTKLLNILEALRSYYGKPITVTSGQRCTKYNNSLSGSSKTSAHLYGKAADIYIPGICNTAAGRNQVKAKAYALGASYSYCNTSGMGNAVHINV